MNYYDAYDEFAGYWEDTKPKSKSRASSGRKRSVKYVGPGHTRVNYAHRTLDIKFRQTPQQFKAKQRSRRRAGARRGAKNRAPRSSWNDGVRIKTDRYGNMIYVDRKGRDVTDKYRRMNDDYWSYVDSEDLSNDAYNLEDMRALLKDARWEEVCGNTRWKWDKKSTVKEFKKYQKYYGGM